MDWNQVAQTCIGALVGLIAWTVQRWFGLKMNEETRKAATWAMEQGVAYAAEKWKDASKAGEVKKRDALATAESLAPKALGKLDDTQKSALIDATYAKMRRSLPHASTYSFSGAELSGAVPLPPPSKVPKKP